MRFFGRSAKRDAPATFLRRLSRDVRGNTLALVAVCILPIAGIVGSGLDMGRAYLVKTRLQQACDAGVLAGRRKMGAGGSLTSVVSDEITKYAQFNFPQKSMDTSTYLIMPTMTASNETINLSLSTTMNTALMQLFGITTVPIAVTCSARDDYSNIDIILVLDTTGSMACKPERTESECSSYANQLGVSSQTTTIGGKTVTYVKEETQGGTNISRMQGLRDALSSLRSQMATLETQFATASASTRRRIRWSIVPFSQMTNPGLSLGTAGTTLYARNPGWFNVNGSYRQSYSCGNTQCAYNAQTSNHSSTWISNTWDGCVEERGTSNSITPNSGNQIPNNLPSSAYDLMFDYTPTASDANTRWTMADEAATGVAQYACPKAMRELNAMTTSDFNDYFKFSTGFVANGGTYLDIGMLWAARLISRTGMWGSDNPVTYNGFKVARYVILMTDGEMQTGHPTAGPIGYGAYAQEKFWKRVTTDGLTNTSDDNHSRRWLMTCTAIKNNMDAKIYSVSFGAGSSLSADLDSCSSGAGYGFKADNSATLSAVFAKIADNIGSLRLSQ